VAWCIVADVKNAKLIVTVLLGSSLNCALGIQNPSPTPTPIPSPTPGAAEAPKRPIKVRVSSGVAEAMKIHDAQPVYPREARKKHIQGDVILRAIIDREGNVMDLKVIEGEPILAEAAMGAVKQWKYKPYLLNGDPVEVETQVIIRFHM
jgi:periplasmic protein TonB